jgi:hypothetical protein
MVKYRTGQFGLPTNWCRNVKRIDTHAVEAIVLLICRNKGRCHKTVTKGFGEKRSEAYKVKSYNAIP